MGVWRIGADVLAQSRFLVSPLIETVSALRMFTVGDPPPDARDWYRTHLPAYRALVADEPLVTPLVQALWRPRWIADFVTPPPDPSDRTFEDAARPGARHAGRRGAGGAARREPAAARTTVGRRHRRPHRRPARLGVGAHGEGGLAAAPAAARGRRPVRTRHLSLGGWSAALDGLRPGMRWLGDGELRINAYDFPPRALADAQLFFVPCTGSRGWVSWDHSGRYAVIYPSTGGLAEPDTERSPLALMRLLGGNRALLLSLLEEPRTDQPAGGAHRSGAGIGERPPDGPARGTAGDPSAYGPVGRVRADAARDPAGGLNSVVAVTDAPYRDRMDDARSRIDASRPSRASPASCGSTGTAWWRSTRRTASPTARTRCR